uniref:GyrI-like small molecule binding domain-containing protein n=1 Tax=Rhodosorus marinus TaxID=101924 RepID=A0A7S3EEJ9_9RHOD|mmetsp:Transcript_26465/g.103098  ORF Transcript_26465/g.103098 Transcript_26465/m.103098 type:complete len:222 (+) Transcript_26465:568-1233(+)|eukprot:CAMPEP_0113963372 /NCGR_PEP_ID=MMETSP0011_2-20120614/6474_1 /TAXON_ID=101924 /ORGANISM="Rhodosorus marinus" /LENGTH=221 /DNA_ID=CAMNT_0000975409 /DNA_START=261 /DNA_END=926 /DNA_ORIENTATION=- /assembly_acc=CAM_ASM_000156
MSLLVGLGVGAAVVLSGVAAYGYAGGFRNVRAQEGDIGLAGKTAMLKIQVGPYEKLSPLFTEVFELECSPDVRRLGIYFDDPMDMKKEFGDCEGSRAMVGVVLEDIPAEEREAFASKLTAAGFEKYTLVSGNCLYSKFRLRCWPMFVPSLLLYLKKVYGELHRAADAKGAHLKYIIEVYEETYNVITYAPLEASTLSQMEYPSIKALDPRTLRSAEPKKDA